MSDIATFLAQHGGAPGASIDVADAARVTEDHLAALGDTLFLTRLPATYTACGRLIAEAGAHDTWPEVGVLVPTKPPTHRPAASYTVSEGKGMLYGTPYRAVVVHSSAQDKRRQQRLARDPQASSSTIQSAARTAEQHVYFCHADADAAAAQLRAVHAASHGLEGTVEAQPVYGRDGPSADKPRPLTAMRYRLKTSMRTQTEPLARLEAEAGCVVLLTNGPPAGDLAHSARDILTVSRDQHGTEQNYGCLKDPVMVHSLCLQKPDRIEALGLILWLALLLWRLMERAMRTYVDTTSTPLPGWDKKATERPTAFMRVTQFAGVIVVKLGHDRHLARPLSVVQQQYLTALAVPAACLTRPTGSQRTALVAPRLSRRQKRIFQWVAAAHQRTRGMIRSSPQDLVRPLPEDKGNSSPSLHTLEARGLLVIGHLPGGKAEALWRTPEGQQGASQLAGRCD